MREPAPTRITFTVILVHPNVLLSEGLRKLLEDTPHKVALHATSFGPIELEATRLQGRLLALVGGSTEAQMVETVRNIRDSLKSAHILVLGAASQPHEVMLALEAGADGYLHEQVTSQTLITAIELLIESGTVLPSAFVKTLALSGRIIGNVVGSNDLAAGLANLEGSASENESVDFEGRSAPDGEPSVQGGMEAAPPGKVTAEVHVRGIMRRKPVKNRAEAAVWRLIPLTQVRLYVVS